MGYIYLILIMTLLIMVAPTLIKLFLIIWLISLIINIFRPKAKQTTFYQEDQFEQQSYHRKDNSDIIDVEFTQRDSKDTE